MMQNRHEEAPAELALDEGIGSHVGTGASTSVVTSRDILALLRSRPDSGASQDDVDEWVARKRELIAAIERQTR